MVSVLLFVSTSFGYDAFHYFGNSSGQGEFIDDSAAGGLQMGGASQIASGASWEDELDLYEVALLTVATGTATPFSTAQVAELQQLLDRGGWLVVLGDDASFSSHNAVFNTLLSDLGSVVSIVDGTFDGACDSVGTPTASTHFLMDQVTGLSFGSSADLDVGAGAELLATGAEGQALLAVDGRIVVGSDSNLITEGCAIGAGNRQFLANLGRSLVCDLDADGVAGPQDTCAGLDCDDSDATVFPGAIDTPYDGVDQDCDGASDFDADGDGFDSDEFDGDDCDDTDPTVFPDAEEVFYDGIDQDCDGASDFDADGDGFDSAEFDGDDCDDADAEISPDAEDVVGDGIDQDCDGADATEPPEEIPEDPEVSVDCGCASGSVTPWSMLPFAVLLPVLARRRA